MMKRYLVGQGKKIDRELALQDIVDTDKAPKIERARITKHVP
jgi:hypothetical protein